ncbi:MAG: NirD/YgiW/YdeI family stress tolerance protein [Chitinivibrionia bacterium]|nr:NirD/YgiW/YdeI family stress tolerance protein [Chitinivibrionia bacterium]
MRKIYLFFAVYFGALAFLPVYGQGGFVGPRGSETDIVGEKRITPVSVARTLRDDTWVFMQGNILRNVRHERYIFADNTGEIMLEIDSDVWQGMLIGANDRIEIFGEIDRNGRRVYVDVKSIRIIER